jgi:hypothetical protein
VPLFIFLLSFVLRFYYRVVESYFLLSFYERCPKRKVCAFLRSELRKNLLLFAFLLYFYLFQTFLRASLNPKYFYEFKFLNHIFIIKVALISPPYLNIDCPQSQRRSPRHNARDLEVCETDHELDW